MGADTDVATGLALFPEPVRGTHASDARLMILHLRVGPGAEPTLLCVGSNGRPGWFPLGEVTFDWRWSDELGRWADLAELVDLPSTETERPEWPTKGNQSAEAAPLIPGLTLAKI